MINSSNNSHKCGSSTRKNRILFFVMVFFSLATADVFGLCVVKYPCGTTYCYTKLNGICDDYIFKPNVSCVDVQSQPSPGPIETIMTYQCNGSNYSVQRMSDGTLRVLVDSEVAYTFDFDEAGVDELQEVTINEDCDPGNVIQITSSYVNPNVLY